jgi:(1->4)-alpha-D-glucan 1-alpha-D-glucosylmutase
MKPLLTSIEYWSTHQEAPLTALDSSLTSSGPAPASFAELVHQMKREIADGSLKAEVLRVQRDLARSGALEPDTQPAEPTNDALAELLSCFPVYRSYLPDGVEYLRQAANLAKKHRPELSQTIDAILPGLSDPTRAAIGSSRHEHDHRERCRGQGLLPLQPIDLAQ